MLPLLDPVAPLFIFFSLWPIPEEPYKCDQYRVKLSDVCSQDGLCAPIRPQGCFLDYEIRGVVFCCEMENPRGQTESCEWLRETLESNWMCEDA